MNIGGIALLKINKRQFHCFPLYIYSECSFIATFIFIFYFETFLSDVIFLKVFGKCFCKNKIKNKYDIRFCMSNPVSLCIIMQI